ncbi:MAG: restriction endonuclease [Anaerolineae bacterium]
MRHRLRDAFGDEVEYQAIGEPVTPQDAQTLAESDPYQFQWWALGLVGARPVEQKKGADKGIDGRLYFHDEAKGKTKQVILSVKAGHTNVTHLRDLRGVVDREKAEMGVLITMQEPTQPMRREAASAGFYHAPGWNTDHPRLQVLTVADLLAGKGIDMPPIRQVSTTFRKAARSRRRTEASQRELDL